METKNRFKQARTDYNQHGPQSIKIVANETGITRSLIEDLESPVYKQRGVSYQKVLKLADHYGVSVDWLLERPGSSRTLDADIGTAHRCTGLSVEAITKLKESEHMTEISYLIEHGHVEALARCLYQYKTNSELALCEDYEALNWAAEAATKGQDSIYVPVKRIPFDNARRGYKADMIEYVIRITQEIDKTYQEMQASIDLERENVRNIYQKTRAALVADWQLYCRKCEQDGTQAPDFETWRKDTVENKKMSTLCETEGN